MNVGNDWTFSTARSAGTATKISVAPMSIPAASGRMTGKAARFDFEALVALKRFGAIHTPSAAQRRPEARKTGTLLIGIATSPNKKLLDVTTALSTGLGTRLATGLDRSIARPLLAAVAGDSAIKLAHACSLPTMARSTGPPGSLGYRHRDGARPERCPGSCGFAFSNSSCNVSASTKRPERSASPSVSARQKPTANETSSTIRPIAIAGLSRPRIGSAAPA